MSIHQRVALSMLSHASWTLDEDFAFFEREGVTTIGVSLAKLEGSGGWKKCVPRIRNGGYRVSSFVGIRPFQLADRSGWTDQRDRSRDALDAAEALAAECVVVTSGAPEGLAWEDAANASQDAFAPLVEDASRRGITIAFEHTNGLRVDIGFLHTLRDAIDFAKRLNARVCMETNACWAERGLADTIREEIDTIALVQLSDFAVGTLVSRDRLVPGDGTIPLERIIGHLLAAGYPGVFELELMGPRIDDEGYDSASKRGMEYVSTLLQKLGTGANT